jgi:hypothetical protein
MYNIQQNFGKYNKVPVCNTIKKILVGKLVTYHTSYRNPLIILAVRRNNLYGNLQILLGEYNGYSISVMSWYNYTGRNSIMFVGRDSRLSIRKCLKLNPKYIAYHLGKSIDLSNVQLYTRPREYKANALLVYDNCNYYKEYTESLSKV